MKTAERIVVGLNASRVARQALSWATRGARLGQAPLLIVRDQPNAADRVGWDDQVPISDSPNDLDPIETVNAIEHRFPGLTIDMTHLSGEVGAGLVQRSSVADLHVLGCHYSISRGVSVPGQSPSWPCGAPTSR
jgi:hypothetical protein